MNTSFTKTEIATTQKIYDEVIQDVKNADGALFIAESSIRKLLAQKNGHFHLGCKSQIEMLHSIFEEKVKDSKLYDFANAIYVEEKIGLKPGEWAKETVTTIYHGAKDKDCDIKPIADMAMALADKAGKKRPTIDLAKEAVLNFYKQKNEPEKDNEESEESFEDFESDEEYSEEEGDLEEEETSSKEEDLDEDEHSPSAAPKDKSGKTKAKPKTSLNVKKDYEELDFMAEYDAWAAVALEEIKLENEAKSKNDLDLQVVIDRTENYTDEERKRLHLRLNPTNSVDKDAVFLLRKFSDKELANFIENLENEIA